MNEISLMPYRSKGFWIALVISFSILLMTARYGIKVMTSVYKTDMGNGVVIYADDYVKTGHWVFDCGYSRLISRQPLPVPLQEIRSAYNIRIGKMYDLNDTDNALAKEVIRDLMRNPDWYKGLSYLYSGLDESSNLRYHSYYLFTKHLDRTWPIELDQSIGYDGKSEFQITARPYDPKTYVDYRTALWAAANSCPVLQ